jgi:hypothetical protein
MSSLPKGERMCTKFIELFANMVVDRRNKIMSRACIEFVQGEFVSFCDFEFSYLFFAILFDLLLFMLFTSFAIFPSSI